MSDNDKKVLLAVNDSNTAITGAAIASKLKISYADATDSLARLYDWGHIDPVRLGWIVTRYGIISAQSIRGNIPTIS